MVEKHNIIHKRGVIKMTENRFQFIHDKNNHTIGFIDNQTERKYTEWYQLPRLINGLNSYQKELIKANQFLLEEIAHLKGYDTIELFLKENPSFEDKMYNVMEK